MFYSRKRTLTWVVLNSACAKDRESKITAGCKFIKHYKKTLNIGCREVLKVHAWVLRLHWSLLSAKAYLVPVLTRLRVGRGEAYRQYQSHCVRSAFATIPLTGLMSLYFFLSPSVWPWLASLADGGRSWLIDSGPMPALNNRHSATLQGHACYPLINQDGTKTGKAKLCAAHQQRCWRQQWQHNSAVPADKGIGARSWESNILDKPWH